MTLHPSSKNLRAHLRLLGVAAAIVAAASGCREAPASRHERSAAADAASFLFTSGEACSAHVSITRDADGREHLHGETLVARGAGAKRCVVEDVTLAPSGRLARAKVAVAEACDGPRAEVVTLDAETGEVRASSPNGAREARAPVGAPWIYAPPSGIATPIAAWVVARATASAAVVRYIDPASDVAPLVARDQVAIETERGVTVVVGNDGADVDATFVERLRLFDQGFTLVRAPHGTAPAARASVERGPS